MNRRVTESSYNPIPAGTSGRQYHRLPRAEILTSSLVSVSGKLERLLKGATMADEPREANLPTENPKDERNISRSIEESLLGAFMLSGALFVTAWDFVIYPNRIAQTFVEKSPKSRYARPVTYFIVTSLLALGAFELLLRLMRQKGSRLLIETPNFFERLFTEGISSLDPKKIILVGIPFLAAVGLYSYAITKSATRRSLNLNFENSLSISCYGAGSGLLIYLLTVPPCSAVFFGKMNWSATNLLGYLPWWSYPISVAGWALLFASMRSYFVLLRTALSTTRRKALSVWGGGLWRFFLWYFLILFWFLPLGFHLIQ